MMLLGKELGFEIDLPDAAHREPELRAMAEAMCGLVNDLSGAWSEAQAEVFRLTDKVVIFVRNTYDGHRLSRSYMASRERTFFWTLSDFTAPGVAGPRRPTMFFHDCWHVRQFLTLGPAPNDREVLIDREQDAMIAQLDAARILDCDASFIGYLERYRDDREAIRARLSQGLGADAQVREHFLVF